MWQSWGIVETVEVGRKRQAGRRRMHGGKTEGEGGQVGVIRQGRTRAGGKRVRPAAPWTCSSHP